MIHHTHTQQVLPKRVVVIGAGGFIGSSIAERLESHGADVLRLTREDVDLSRPDAADKIATLLKPDDCIVFVAAKAPVKNLEMLQDNLKIIGTFADVIKKSKPAHVLNISSDAIYHDSMAPLDEMSPCAPTGLHGVMHLTREIVLSEATPENVPFCSLRPTLVYGQNDPHNGYGPNKFRRLAQSGEPITFFGKGEERRDHVWVDDVAELAARILLHKSSGTLNAATGSLISFYDVGKLISDLSDQSVELITTTRTGPMPHDGYRSFDAAATIAAFPDFAYVQPQDGVAALLKGTNLS